MNKMNSNLGSDLFIGIDWSGARKGKLPGVSIAVADAFGSPPKIVNPPRGGWNRRRVVAWLIFCSRKKKLLVGFDFGFSHPFIDCNSYYPNSALSFLKKPVELWQFIDDSSKEFGDFYGGGIWNHSLASIYYNAPNSRRGKKFQSRLRVTEYEASKEKYPSSTFNCVGPASVGTGTLAGMRVLNYFQNRHSSLVRIWPFAGPAKNYCSPMTVVEVFPSLYFYRSVGQLFNKKDQNLRTTLNTALASFRSEPYPDNEPITGPDLDDADALVSAAALRFFATREIYFDAPFQNPYSTRAAMLEGWIFGVRNSGKFS